MADNHQATLNGILVDDGGGACDCWFEWGLTAALGNTTPIQSGKVTGDSVSWTITGLAPSTKYYFRFAASNSFGTTYGTTLTFTTLISMALVVSTLPATNIWDRGAKLNGSVDVDMGYPCEVYFQYGGTSALGMETGKLSGISAGTSFDIDISGVNPGRAVYFRAVAVNRYGVAHGVTLMFSTPSREGNRILMQDLYVSIIGG